jgi:N-acetylglucosaminyldiphosphoundecaprenol N-acetyl-beta-D-mannosaminyltransferase
MKRVSISGVSIDVVTAEDAAHWVRGRIEHGVKTSVAAVNAALVVMATRDESYSGALKDFDLVIADGVWTAVAASLLCRCRVPYTNTSPFIRALFRRPEHGGLRVFLLGARADVVEKAAVELPRLYPTVSVVGHEDGYFGSDEEARILERVNSSGAHILLIGMSSPQKEMFIRKYWSQLNVPVAFGIGGLIDIWGGKTVEAPSWVKHSGLEWLFRFMQEPKRLW